MRKYKLSVLAFGLMLLIASCKKEDVQQANTQENSPAAVSSVQTSAWKSISNWTSSKGEKLTSYFSKLSDTAVTADVAGSGLVMAFVKNNSGIQALPYLQKDNSYWFYQVAKGSVSFSVDDYSGATGLNSSQFAYFVFTPQKLKELESTGYTKSKLMQMSYSDLSSLFNK